HIAFFVVCGFVNMKNKKFIIVIAFFLILYGITIEVVQGNFIPGRMFEYKDILANSLGTIFGTILAIRTTSNYAVNQ
ncbi:MAG: VanZ family protein, partial [Flavobacteriales bacterium]|nr:VanZ family protein [Flavobacteriales bacterium]